MVISELDTNSKTTQITLVKPVPIQEGPDVEEVAWQGANYIVAPNGHLYLGRKLRHLNDFSAAGVRIAALFIHGIRPGPLIMIEQPQFVGLISAMLIMATVVLGQLWFFYLRGWFK